MDAARAQVVNAGAEVQLASGGMSDAAPNEAENVEQPEAIVTQRRLEVNPKAYGAGLQRFRPAMRHPVPRPEIGPFFGVP